MKALCSVLLATSAAAKVTLSKSDDQISISNGYVSAELSVAGGAWISKLQGDFQGNGNYGINLLADSGIRVERLESSGDVTSAAGKGDASEVNIVRDDGSCAEFTIPSVYDDVESPVAVESWTVSLCDGDRSLRFDTKGGVIDASAGSTLRGVVHSLYSSSLSTYAFFDQGVVQMKDAAEKRSHFGSIDKLNRFYILGGSGAIDVIRPSATGGEDDVTVLKNSQSNPNFRGGFQEVLIGTFSERDYWCSGWEGTEKSQAVAGKTWAKSWIISPNNRNFPSGSLPAGAVDNLDNGDDLDTFMTGIYANAVGCLCTYPGEVKKGYQVGQIATTIRIDNAHGYNDTYNYFDPDNFISLSAILYSGDPYLLNQARLVIERSGSFLKEDNGQLPHHFNGIQPYYLALSGETQTGPNTFWTKTALQYAFVSGDLNWLKNYMPTLRNASSFVFDLIESDNNLLFAPGSLMIDVFIRNNYTSDSNAMVVGFLRDFAEAERAVGNEGRAVQLESQADNVVTAMNAKLWADSAGDDHFITQLNIDGSIRDFVDYDSNLIAVANQVTDESRSRAIFSRIDRGRCSASSGAGPQFVSEEYYGEFDTTNGNQGDSWCSMARIGW